MKHNNRLRHAPSDYLAQFDAAAPSYYGNEAEIVIHEDLSAGKDWAIAMPTNAGRIDPHITEVTKAALASILELDQQAHAFLESSVRQPEFAAHKVTAPLGDHQEGVDASLQKSTEHDPELYLLIVHSDHVRLCYDSTVVNDEWTVRFDRAPGGWVCSGFTWRQ